MLAYASPAGVVNGACAVWTRQLAKHTGLLKLAALVSCLAQQEPAFALGHITAFRRDISCLAYPALSVGYSWESRGRDICCARHGTQAWSEQRELGALHGNPCLLVSCSEWRVGPHLQPRLEEALEMPMTFCFLWVPMDHIGVVTCQLLWEVNDWRKTRAKAALTCVPYTSPPCSAICRGLPRLTSVSWKAST